MSEMRPVYIHCATKNELMADLSITPGVGGLITCRIENSIFDLTPHDALLASIALLDQALALMKPQELPEPLRERFRSLLNFPEPDILGGLKPGLWRIVEEHGTLSCRWLNDADAWNPDTELDDLK